MLNNKTYRIVFADNYDSFAVDAIAHSVDGLWSDSIQRFNGEHDLAFIEVSEENAEYLEAILNEDENVIYYEDRT